MNILETIVEHKREELSVAKRNMRLSALAELPANSRETVSLRRSVLLHPTFGIIAEIKRRSPAGGELRKDVLPGLLAEQYESNGASGISVLTDGKFFGGSLEDLAAVRSRTEIPLLRKDFLLDEYQLFEARAYGADAVLLIASLLDRSQLLDLHQAAVALGLESLVELYTLDELDILDLDQMQLVGINNRDLRTFEVDINRTFLIAEHLPSNVTVVSESGIKHADDLRNLASHGVKAALIGESLMTSDQPGRALHLLLEGLDA